VSLHKYHFRGLYPSLYPQVGVIGIGLLESSQTWMKTRGPVN